MISVRGQYPPIIATMPSGTYAISGAEWVLVPATTTLADVEWEHSSVAARAARYFRTVSSRTGEEYIIRLGAPFDNCTCVGYMYRHKCKHLDAARNGELEELQNDGR